MPAFGYYGCKDIASGVRDSEISPVKFLVCFNCESSKRRPYIEGIAAKKKNCLRKGANLKTRFLCS